MDTSRPIRDLLQRVAQEIEDSSRENPLLTFQECLGQIDDNMQGVVRAIDLAKSEAQKFETSEGSTAIERIERLADQLLELVLSARQNVS